LCRHLLERIEALNPRLSAFITVDPDAVFREARIAEQQLWHGDDRGPLHGIPVAYKDIFYTRGLRTTAHSKVLASFVPDVDATVVARLKAAGTITLGKTNTHEFACGGMEFYGFARNPWDLSRVPGGSSSGSAVAVVAGLAPVALGSDTGGSIRIPASFCGCVGLKPTFGRVSRVGMTPLSWHMDHAGPLTCYVADAALTLNVIAGHDPRDATTAVGPVPDFVRDLERGVRGLRVGVPRSFFFEGIDEEVAAAVRRAIQVLEDLGAHVEEIDIPHAELASAAHYVLTFAEAATLFHRELNEQPHNFGRATYHRLLQGRFFTAREYLNAMRVRALIIRETAAAMRRVDVIVTPTTTTTAYRIENFVQAQSDVGRLTRIADLTGQPSLSLPCGFNRDGLPIGLLITGHAWDEATVLRVGYAYEQAAGWYRRRPPLAEGSAPAAGEPEPSRPAPAGGGKPAEPDLGWMRRFAELTGFPLSEGDLEGVLEQLRPLRRALARIDREVDLSGVEFPFEFRPRDSREGRSGAW
ncbi:MAG TPA: amidase, partial [Bacillota bacterium]